MSHIADVVPDADVLVALEPDELGLRILQVLASWSGVLSQIELGNFVNGGAQSFPTSNQREEIKQALREAWAWLEGQGLLLQDARYYGGGVRVLSRKARRLAKEPNARRALTGHRMPKESLHPSIREDVWSLYHRGKYDTAVFEAMKAVEVAVRDATKLETKNPHSHRRVELDDPDEAAEIILLANHLLRIVDARRP